MPLLSGFWSCGTSTACVPRTCTRTEHHVCLRACQDAHKKDVFKEFNLSMYETEELVMGPSGGTCNFATFSSSSIGTT